jgi:hypothetical protein
MTNAALSAQQASLVPDPAVIQMLSAADQQLNAALGPFLTQAFPDYDRTSLAKGIYHPVGSAAQNMAPTAPIPCRA